jgi:hypothetical protein
MTTHIDDEIFSRALDKPALYSRVKDKVHTRVLRGEETDFEVVTSVDGTASIEEVPPRIKERQKSADSLAKMLSDGENTNRTELALDKLFDKLEEEINGD